MRILLFLPLVLLLSVVFPTSAQQLPLLVTPAWVQAHLHDADLVVLHVTSLRREYLNGHIPDAPYLWSGWLTASNPELSNEIAPIASIDTVLEGLGVSGDSRIVLCFNGMNAMTATRAFFVFEYAGFADRVAILDGGLDAWRREGLPVSVEVPHPKRGTVRLASLTDRLADFEYVRQHLNAAGTCLVDARPTLVYEGSSAPRTGHIPGAVNIYQGGLFDSLGRFRSLDELRAAFSRSARPGDEVVTYCGSGQSASVTYFVSRLLGYRSRLYDGSFEEWGAREELPIEGKKDKK